MKRNRRGSGAATSRTRKDAFEEARTLPRSAKSSTRQTDRDNAIPSPGSFLIPVGSIRVGQRHRRKMGDIAELAASIADVGLLHPVVVTPNNLLIAGERRLTAVKLLGWAEVPVTVVDLQEVVAGEYAENSCRKQFTPSEMVAIAAAIEPLERAKAKERQGERTDQHPGKFPTSPKGRALDKVARVVGKDRKTLIKARAVVEAAEAEPERFGKLVEDMDATGKVDRAHRQLIIARRQQEHAQRTEQSFTVAHWNHWRLPASVSR